MNNNEFDIDLLTYIKYFCEATTNEAAITKFFSLLGALGIPVDKKSRSSGAEQSTINGIKITALWNNGTAIQQLLKSEVTSSGGKPSQIREVIFNQLRGNGFNVEDIAKAFCNKIFDKKQLDFIEQFMDKGFINITEKATVKNLLPKLVIYDQAAWIFVFLCFPLTEETKPETHNRSELLNIIKNIWEQDSIEKSNSRDRDNILTDPHSQSKRQPTKKNEEQQRPIIIAGQTVSNINRSNIGREEILADIKEKISAGVSVLLYGIGGIGKTFICRKLFSYYRNTRSQEIKYLLWIQYKTTLESSLINSFADDLIHTDLITKDSYIHTLVSYIRKNKEPAQKVYAIYQLLEYLGNELLIFINDINSLPPKEIDWLNSSNCRLVISSRCKTDAFYAINIKGTSLDYCCELYRENCDTKESDKFTDEENESIRQIIKLAGYHTLSIKLIAKTQYSSFEISDANEMLELLKAKGYSIANVAEAVEEDGENLTIIEHLSKVFDISDIRHNDMRIWIMRCFSLLSPNSPIKGKIIKCWFDLKDSKDINGLVDSGWLNRETNGCFSIPPVISDVIRHLFKPDYAYYEPLIKNMTQYVCTIGNDHNSNMGVYEYTAEIVDVLKHCMSVADRFDNIKEDSFDSLLGVIFFVSKDIYPTEVTLRYCDIILDKAKDETLETPLEKSAYNMILGFKYSLQNEEAKAVEYLEKSIEICPEYYEETPPLKVYIEIANCYLKSQNYYKSHEYYDRVIDLYKSLKGENSVEVGLYYAQASLPLMFLKKYDEASEYLRKSEQILNNVHSGKFIELIKPYKSMLFYMQDDVRSANELLENLSEMKRLYNYNPKGLLYLAEVCLEDGKTDKTAELLHEALNTSIRVYGEKHPLTVITKMTIARLYLKADNNESASKYSKDAFKLANEISLNSDSIYGADYANEILMFTRAYSEYIEEQIDEIGNYESAIALRSGSIELYLGTEPCLEMLGEKRPHSVSMHYYNIATLYYKNNDLHNALIYANKALELQKSVLHDDAPDTISTMELIAEIKRSLVPTKELHQLPDST